MLDAHPGHANSNRCTCRRRGESGGVSGVSQGRANSVRAPLSDPWPVPSDPLLESRDSGWRDDQAQDSGHFLARQLLPSCICSSSGAEVSMVFPCEAPPSTLQPEACLRAGQSRTGSAGSWIGGDPGWHPSSPWGSRPGLFEVWSVTESRHKLILTRGNIAWKLRAGTEKLL